MIGLSTRILGREYSIGVVNKMTDKVVNLAARRASLEELDRDLMARLEKAIIYVEMGIDIAKSLRDIDEGDETDGLVMMRRTLGETKKRLEQLSPYL